MVRTHHQTPRLRAYVHQLRGACPPSFSIECRNDSENAVPCPGFGNHSVPAKFADTFLCQYRQQQRLAPFLYAGAHERGRQRFTIFHIISAHRLAVHVRVYDLAPPPQQFPGLAKSSLSLLNTMHSVHRLQEAVTLLL